MPVIKLDEKDTCWTIFEAYQWRVSIDKKMASDMLQHFMNVAIEKRKAGNVDESNEYINFACAVKNLYWCCFQGSKKARRAFGIKEVDNEKA